MVASRIRHVRCETMECDGLNMLTMLIMPLFDNLGKVTIFFCFSVFFLLFYLYLCNFKITKSVFST